MIHPIFEPFIDFLFSNDLTGRQKIAQARALPPLEGEDKNEIESKQVPE
jgi:hypothetical protein